MGVYLGGVYNTVACARERSAVGIGARRQTGVQPSAANALEVRCQPSAASFITLAFSAKTGVCRTEQMVSVRRLPQEETEYAELASCQPQSRGTKFFTACASAYLLFANRAIGRAVGCRTGACHDKKLTVLCSRDLNHNQRQHNFILPARARVFCL